MPDKTYLKPCPFCGQCAVKCTTKSDAYHRIHSKYKSYVRCLKCNARGPAVTGKTAEESARAAVDAWQWRLPEIEMTLE